MESMTSQLLARVREQQDAATRISALTTACGGPPPGWEALGEVAADVDLKASLWRGLREWGEAGGGWLGQRLFGLDVAAVEDTVRLRIPICLFS